MKYQANPVIVDAFAIVEVRNRADRDPFRSPVSGIYLVLENGESVDPTKEMMARMAPNVGDYWVIQSDGYIYLNPKDVFERKYSKVLAA